MSLSSNQWKKHEYVLLYKCRLCGAIVESWPMAEQYGYRLVEAILFGNDDFPDDTEIDKESGESVSVYQGIDRISTHQCSEQITGFADVVAYRKREIANE